MTESVKVQLRFITCTLAEAVEELNIQLETAMLPTITEDNLVSQEKQPHAEDWFDDYLFIFETTFNEAKDDIVDKMKNCMIDYNIITN